VCRPCCIVCAGHVALCVQCLTRPCCIVCAVPESNGGQYLTRRGDFNAGNHINAFFRVQCKSAAPLGASADVKALMADKRHVTFFGKFVGGSSFPRTPGEAPPSHILQVGLHPPTYSGWGSTLPHTPGEAPPSASHILPPTPGGAPPSR
jgi:hypothetical protein